MTQPLKTLRELTEQAIDEVQSLITQKASDFRCSECQAVIELPADSLERLKFDRKCPTCREKSNTAAAKAQNEREAAARESRLAQVPELFRSTQRHLLPHPQKLDAALLWRFDALGLLLMGASRAGKSRIAWEIAKREIMVGRTFKAVTAFSLSRFPSLFMAGDDAAGKVADELVAVDVLLLDDVFKAKATERVEELLFGVIDERAQWGRPCIVTLNDTAATLAERLSSDRGPALIARLREHCQIISFKSIGSPGDERTQAP